MNQILTRLCLALMLCVSAACGYGQTKAPTKSQGKAQSQVKVQTQTVTANGVSFRMIGVEGGTFQMGNATGEGKEKPLHKVSVGSFSIGQTEVTQELWEAVMGSNPSSFAGSKCPVEKVTWKDCQDFIVKLNRLTGKTFRLPTEAEWEYAARGGNKSRNRIFSGSNSADDVAWHMGNTYNLGTDSPEYGTHEVATKAPNELGIYDMSGNVWEWCQDWYAADYYSSSATDNPTGPSFGSERVCRGGSWGEDAQSCRVSNRVYCLPTRTYNSLGLRLAM